MAFPILAVMAIVQAAAAAAKAVQQKNLADQVNPEYKPYKVSDYVKSNLGLAKQLYGGRMPGASQLQDNIFSQQANAQANIDRNATSGAQALALAGAVQGQTNQSLGQLAEMENQNKLARYGILEHANLSMADEEAKVYDANMAKYREDVAAKTALRQSSAQNWGNALNGALSIAGSMQGMGSGQGGSITGSVPNAATVNTNLGSAQSSINTGLATRSMPLTSNAMLNPYMNPMLKNGFNTNTAMQWNPPKYNYLTGRYE